MSGSREKRLGTSGSFCKAELGVFYVRGALVIDQDSLLELSESGLLLSQDSDDSDSFADGGCADGWAAVPRLRLNPKH